MTTAPRESAPAGVSLWPELGQDERDPDGSLFVVPPSLGEPTAPRRRQAVRTARVASRDARVREAIVQRGRASLRRAASVSEGAV